MSNTKPHENLYNALTQQGYDVGDLDQFTEKIKDAQKRRALFDAISTEFNVGDFDNFENTINYLWNNEDAHLATPSGLKAPTGSITSPFARTSDVTTPPLPEGIGEVSPRDGGVEDIQGDESTNKHAANLAQYTFKAPEQISATEVLQRNAETIAGINGPAGLTKSPDPIQQAVSQDLINKAASQEWQRDTLKHYQSEKERLQALYNQEIAKTSGRQFSSSFMDYNPSADTAMSRDASLYSLALQYLGDAEKQIIKAQKKSKASTPQQRNADDNYDLSQWQQSPSQYGYAPISIPGVKAPNKEQSQSPDPIQEVVAGVGDALFDIDSLTLGLDSLFKNATLKAILDKADADQPLTQAEESLLNAALYKQFTEAAYPDSRWYNVGKGIGSNIPYMLQFALSGGVAGALTKGAGKKIGKAVTKYIDNLALKNGSKIANRTARNVFTRGSRALGNGVSKLSAGTLKALAQTPLQTSLYNDIIERQIGTLGYSPSASNSEADGGVNSRGGLQYTGRIDAESSGDAIRNGLASAFITNITEGIGGEGLQFIFNKIGGGGLSALGKGYTKLTGKQIQSPRLYNLFREAVSKRGLKPLLDAVGFNGAPSEFAEEILDGLANALIVGDQSVADVLDKDNLIDTAITTGVISLFMGAMGAGLSFKVSHDVNKAFAQANRNLEELKYSNIEIQALNDIAIDNPQNTAKWVSSITRTMRTLATSLDEITNSLSPEARQYIDKENRTEEEFNELSLYDQQAVLAFFQIRDRFNELTIQRDYVVAGTNYNAMIQGLKERVAPQAEAELADIQANALRDSDYTINVKFKGQDGYLVSGTAEINDLPDGSTEATLPAGNIYQVRTKSPDGQWLIQQAIAEDIQPISVTPTQQLIDETTARIYSPVQNLINAEQAQAQAEVAQSQPPVSTPNGPVVQTEQAQPSVETTPSGLNAPAAPNGPVEQTTPTAEQTTPSAEQREAITPPLPEGIGEVSRSDGGVNTQPTSATPSGLNAPEAPNGSTQSTEEQPLSDEQFDEHIATLPTGDAIQTITQRRGAEEADQYAQWRKGILTKERDKAHKTLNAKHKPFDPSRYTDYAQMKREERKHNDAIQATRNEALNIIQQTTAEIAHIDRYLADRNRQIAAEREAENPLRNGIAPAVAKLSINTLEQYIARYIALGGRLRMTDQYSNGLAAELGITPGSQEHRELLSILSNTEGMTPEQLAHDISENIEPEYRHLIAGRDVQDIRNAIIDTIASGVTSRRRAYQYIADANEKLSADEQRYIEEQELQAQIDADTEQAIRDYEELLLSSLTPDDLAIIDTMAGDYWDEISIQQYDQEAYNSLISPSAELGEDRGSGAAEGVVSNSQNIQTYDTNPTSTTPRITQQGAESTAIQSSTQPSNTTPIRQDSQDTATIRPETPQTSRNSSTRQDVVELQPINVGQFGPIYNQFRGKAQEAIAFLSQKQDGEAVAALNHPEIGDIDLVWGNAGTGKSDGYGLAKLVKYHPEVLNNLQEIINDMHVTQRSMNRVQLESDTHQAAVRLTWNDEKKNWLLTAFEKKNSASDNTTDTDETSTRGKQNDTATPQNTVSTHKDTTNSQTSNELNEKIVEAETEVNTNPTETQKENIPAWLEKVPNDGRNFFVYVKFADAKNYQAIDLAKGVTVDRLVYASSVKKDKLRTLVEKLPNALLEDAEFQIRDAKGKVFYDSIKEKVQASQAPNGSNGSNDPTTDSYTITPTQYTTKRRNVLDMHLVKFNNELTKEQYRTAKELAKADKGWWDKSLGGFMMRSQESAQQLADTIASQPISMTDVKAINDGDIAFTEPANTPPLPEGIGEVSRSDGGVNSRGGSGSQRTPIWQYSIHVDTDGYTVLTREDVSSGTAVGDAHFSPAADSPEEMLEILRNPHNNMQEVLDAVGVILENKIQTRELDRKIAEQRKQEYEALRANGVNGYEIGEKVIYKGKEATIHDFEQFGAHQPVLDTGMAPVIYEVAEWSDIEHLDKDKSPSGLNAPVATDTQEQPTNQGQFGLVSDDRMAELKERLRRKLGGQMNIGIDPEILSIGLEIAVGHLDRGIKSFTDFARVMIADLGDTIRPYLKAFYNGARDLPEVIDNGLATDMTPYDEVQQFDITNFDRTVPDLTAAATNTAREAEVANEVNVAKQRIKRSTEKKKSLPSSSNQLNLFDNTDNNNEDAREQDTRTNNRGTQPRREELPETESVEPRTPLQHAVEIGRSKRGNTRTSGNQSGDRSLYDVNKNHSNEEISHIVSSVTDIVDGRVVITAPITDDIRAICHQYKSGGVAKKGHGILDEYYTDGKIVDAVSMLITPYFNNSAPIRVLEPSVGVGNFISAVDNIPTSEIVTFEINPTTARIAKILYPGIDVNLRSFESEFIDDAGNKKPLPQKYNLIIGNPPYGSHRGLYKGLGEESKIARYEDYFVKRSLDVLNEGGLLAMVLPSSWIDRHTQYGGYTIEAAYRLPSGAFEATQVGTDIVILRKDSSIPTADHTPYFEQHPERVLGEVKQRKGRYGKMEYYVQGDIDTAIEAIKRDHAEQLANRLDITPSNDNLNNIEEAIDETGSLDKATAIVQTAKTEANSPAPSTTTGKKSKYKTELNRGAETVPTSQQFSHQFSEGEVEAFYDTDYDGTINHPSQHRKYANYIGGRAMHDFYYAEGDIYAKLDQLESEKENIISTYGQEQYDKQKRLLMSVLPKRKGLSEITISPNTTFVKNLYIDTDKGSITLRDAFVDFCSKLPYQAFGDSSSWEVRGYVNNEQVYGQDKERNALVRERRKRVANDLFVKFLNEELSQSAQNQVVAAFNREYNSTYRPDYSRVPMFSTINKDFRGRPLKLTSVQLAGIGRMTVKGVGVLAHEVGFGKTLSGILAMHEAMTRGFATKPLIVVPNDNILKQWVETIKEVLPQATVNTLGNLGTSYDLTDFKVNDGEFTLVTYEGLKAMSFSDDTYNRLAERFSYITEDLKKHKSERDQHQEIEKKQELKGRMKRGAKTSYGFEDFGFDWLTVDEVHNCNHIVSKVRLDKSVSSDFRSQNQRTSDLGLKTWLAAQYIQEENNGRNVLLLSATPFTNKPLEYYSILSLVGNKMLKRKGFFHVDQFFSTFMEADNELEIGANGRPTQKTNVRRFRNNGLFQQLLSEFIDIKGEEDNPELVRPDRHNKEYKINPNELTEDAMAAVQDLLNDNDTVLQGIGHARAAAFSPYATSLLGIRPKNHREFVKNSPKINTTIKLIEQNKKDRPDAGQIIYSEVGVEYFPMIRDYLVNESGFKPSEVRIITGATSNAERFNIQTAFNKGEVKVVIGSPAIKEGLNLQENTTDMYILSLPWNFTQLRQIEGRGWRQGNKWENIRINYMLTNNSVDVFMLQRLQLKQGLYNEAMKKGAETLDVSDIDTSELKTALITDPAVRAEIVTKQEREKLQQQRTQIEADLSFVLRKYESYNKLIEELESRKKEINSIKEWAEGHTEYSAHWADRVQYEENRLNAIVAEIQEEKERLQKKGVNVDDIVLQTEQSQKTIEDINQKIENLKEYQEELTDKYRREQELKQQQQGDLLATYIKERKAENNSGSFYKIRPKDSQPSFRSINPDESLSDYAHAVVANSQQTTTPAAESLPENIKDRFSFRELDEQTFSAPASDSAIGEVPQGEGVKELSPSPEEQAIIDQAKANGTYLLAPNGQPTNLTPRQWVQVRTRAFKEWFGDWEKQARINKLRNSEPINIVFNNQYDLNRESAKQWMKDNIRGEYTNKDSGETIQISRVGINEVTSHGTKDNAHLVSISAIPQLIENSIFIEEIPNEKENDKYDSYRYYVCGAKINGDDYTIKVVIGVKGDSKYYDHRLTQIEKGILIDNLNGLSNSVAENQNASYSMGKDSKLLSILQTNASKIIDSNGEPRVMYHGSNYRPLLADGTFKAFDGALGKGIYFTSAFPEAADYVREKLNDYNLEEDEIDNGGYVTEAFLNIRDNDNIAGSKYGYDEIITWAEKSNQIKSATENIGTFDNRFNDIRFRSLSDTARQVAANDMPRRIEERTAQLAGKLGVTITVLHSNNDLRSRGEDFDILADWLDGNLDGRTHRMAGMFDAESNQLFVFAHNIAQTADPMSLLEETITHEVVAHYGLRQLLGDNGLNTLLSGTWSAMPHDLQIRWGKYAMNHKRTDTLSAEEMAMLYSDARIQRKAAEEYIAHLSETGVTEPTLWQHICALFRRIMRKLGIFSYSPTEADIRYILSQSYRNLTNKSSDNQQSPAALNDSDNNPETRFRFIGEQGAANLDRAEEATTRLDNLAVARDMEQAGKDEHTIKLATGWERGADNLWRYEVPDVFNIQYPSVYTEFHRYIELNNKFYENSSQLTSDEMEELDKLSILFYGGKIPPITVRLRQLIDDYDLFDTYPLLINTTVNITDTKGEAYYSPISNQISIDSRFNKNEFEHILAHEIQHAIQDIEGFARGGNERTADALQDKAQVWAWRNDLVRTAKKYPDLAGTTAIENLLIDEYTQGGLQQFIPTESQRIKAFNLYVRGYDNEGYQSAWEQIWKVQPGNDEKTYLRLAGEVEARNVQRRLNLTPEERAKTLAAETEDVAREDQIFIGNALGTSAMGSRVEQRMKEIASHYQGRTLSPTEQAIVDVFSGTADNLPITVKTADGNTRRIIMRQGKEQNAGTKHSLFRHYNTGSGVITADDILLIPEVIANGTRTEKNKGKVEYKYTHDNGTKYTVLTEKNNRGAEVFADFYTNKSGNARSSNTQLSAQADSITALSADKDNINSVNNKTFFRSIASDNRTADTALDSIEQATADYADSLNTERQAIIDAITPAPDDSLRTIAEKIRYREIGRELVTRDNTELEKFTALPNKISNAMADNDARHKHTAIAESQFDSMQRLHNLIDDLRKQGALIDERFDPWLTQNQSRSRAQAETNIFDLTYRPPLYDAIARGIRALFPDINTEDKSDNAKGYSHLSLYAQARTAVERQAIKSAQARAEAEEKGEEYKERDFGGLAGIQEAIFGLYSAIDNDVEAAKGNIEKLTALAIERGIPTVQEYIDNAEAKLGNPDNNGTAAHQLWTAIRSISAYQLTYSYKAGLISRAGYQTLTYGRNIDGLLRKRYSMQVQQIKDNPGSYDNVTDYDKDGNATGKRMVLNDNARIALNKLNKEYAEAIDAVPMPGKNGSWQQLIDTGWLTEEDVNSLHRYYMYYMPLKGHAELTAEDIAEYEHKTPRNISKIKAVEGHSHLAKDPFNQLILDTHGAIQNAEQNRWRTHLYNILTNNPNPSQYIVEQRFYKIETNSDGSKEYVPYGKVETINGAKVFIPGRPTAEELANGTAVSYNNRFTRAEVDIPIRNYQRTEHSVTVMVDGEAYTIFFYDKRIADAINGTNIKRPSDIWKQLDKLQALNRLYAGLKTSLNPTFTLISNLPRDWMEMVSNNLIEHGVAHAVASLIYRVRATRAGDVQAALRKHQEGKLLTMADATTDVERYVVEFFNNGGSVNITQLPDYNTAKVELMDDLNTYMRTGQMPKGSAWARGFNNMAERVELAPRLATYIASRTLGRNISQSINDAKEATVNFDRKGSWSGIMGMFQLFYNAAAQSVRRQIGLARRHPLRFFATYATIFLTSPLSSIIASYISSLLLGDDDDIEDICRKYFAINPELRRRYFIILIGDSYYRIPMAVNYLPYVTLGDVIANWRLNPNYRPNVLKDTLDIASAILDTFLPSMIAQPIGFMFDAITAKNEQERAQAFISLFGSAFNRIPILEPLGQSLANYNFMGSTLYDRPFDKNSQEPAYLRARQYTQPVWVWASHLLNDITGGNEVHAGLLNIAPEQIENIMTIFGGYGEFGENIISLGIETLSILSGEKPDTEVFKKSFPLLSRLYGGNTAERYDKSMQSMFFDDTTALAQYAEYRKNATTASTRADFDRTYSPDEQRYFADLNTMQTIAKRIREDVKAATPEGEAPKYHADERLKAIYNLANEQFHSLASGEYKPVDDPYYTYMYIKDAIEKAPHRTADGSYRLLDLSGYTHNKPKDKDTHIDVSNNISSSNDNLMYQLVSDYRMASAQARRLPQGYYPTMPLSQQEQQQYDLFVKQVDNLRTSYDNINLDNLYNDAQ